MKRRICWNEESSKEYKNRLEIKYYIYCQHYFPSAVNSVPLFQFFIRYILYFSESIIQGIYKK